jgi:hypothetical protein
VQPRPQFHHSRKTVDLSGSALTSQRAKSRTGIDLWWIGRVRHSGNVVLRHFWRNLRSVLVHETIHMHPKSWSCLLTPKIQTIWDNWIMVWWVGWVGWKQIWYRMTKPPGSSIVANDDWFDSRAYWLHRSTDGQQERIVRFWPVTEEIVSSANLLGDKHMKASLEFPLILNLICLALCHW